MLRISERRDFCILTAFDSGKGADISGRRRQEEEGGVRMEREEEEKRFALAGRKMVKDRRVVRESGTERIPSVLARSSPMKLTRMRLTADATCMGADQDRRGGGKGERGKV